MLFVEIALSLEQQPWAGWENCFNIQCNCLPPAPASHLFFLHANTSSIVVHLLFIFRIFTTASVFNNLVELYLRLRYLLNRQLLTQL